MIYYVVCSMAVSKTLETYTIKIPSINLSYSEGFETLINKL